MAKKTAAKRVAKRTYDNETRENASQRHRESIIQSLVLLLAKSKGVEVPMSDIAKHSGVSERTIFRFFKDKQALMGATADYVGTFLERSAKQINARPLAEFAQHAFQEFEANDGLTLAYLLSSFGQQARPLIRKNWNKALLEKVDQEMKIRHSAKTDARLALIVTLVNARVWYELKSDFKMSGKESGDTVAWAIKTLLAAL